MAWWLPDTNQILDFVQERLEIVLSHMQEPAVRLVITTDLHLCCCACKDINGCQLGLLARRNKDDHWLFGGMFHNGLVSRFCHGYYTGSIV